MTVAANVRKAGPTPGNSLATVFPFSFKVFNATDILVQQTVIASGLVSTLVLNDPLGYTVALNPDQNANPGGSITYNPLGVPMPATLALTISSIVPQVQGTHITNGGAFFANNIEDAVDKAVINVQDLSTRVASAVQFPSVDSAALNAILPPALQRANLVLGFDASGNVIVTSGGSNIPISGAWTPVVQAATLALGRAAMGFSAYFDSLIGAATKAACTALFTPLTTKGDLWSFGAADARLAAGTDNQALLADSTAANGLRYVTLGAGSVRQSVQQGVQDANGYANMLTTGAGLRPGLSATAKPMVVAFAAGFGQAGAADLVSTVSADVADVLGADLKLNNTAYVHASYTSPAAVSWLACYVPPDYGYAFDRTRGALLNFEGINGAATTTDDFGNTWTLTGATISTAQFKFGASSLDCTGGGAKSASSANFTTLGDGSWEASIWFRIGALPGVGTEAALISLVNAGGFGMTARLRNTAGTTTTVIYLSSDGATWNIANGSTGANTVWALNQWNKMRVVFDALAGTYRIYLSLNGAAETQDFSVSSSSRINGVSQCKLAQDAVGTSQFNGYLDAFRSIRAATNTTTEVPAAVAPAIGDYPYHWFSIPDMKMYEATAASGAAGVNPTLTARNRCFIGEADTSGAAVTAVRNYALRGQYLKEGISPANDTVTAFSDNLGTKVKRITAWTECFTNENSELVGNRTELRGDGNAGTGAAWRGSTTLITGTNTIRLVMSVNPVLVQNQGSTSAFASQTNGNYKIGVRVDRSF